MAPAPPAPRAAPRRRRRERLLRDDGCADSRGDASQQRPQFSADLARHAVGDEAPADHLGVPPGRGQDQHALGRGFSRAAHLASAVRPDVDGAAGEDAAELVSGGPTCRPPAPNSSSRIDRSWLPVRFFTTEIACFTSPAASKYRNRTTVSAT